MSKAITRSQEQQLKAISLRLDPSLYSILIDRAKQNTRSINGEINSILKEYLTQQRNERQSALDQDNPFKEA